MTDRGYIHLYTGNGKGKTTAALGLVMRAAGAGLRCLVIQFMKGKPTSEIESAAKLGGAVSIEQYGSDRFCRPEEDTVQEHRELALKGLDRARDVLQQGKLDLVVLDEIITATLFDLVSQEEIIELMKLKPGGMELVLTGRGATGKLIEHADLATEMVELKHYYTRGVPARRGIEI